MRWRATAHDYTRAGVYHITIHVADELGQVLGKVVGNLSAPDGTPDAPRTALTPIGQMVEYELLHTIHAFYPMITIQDYVIMPEHLHALMVVQDRIVSQNGKIQTIGQVIAGFKLGCNRRYWEIIQRAKPALTLTRGERRVEPALALTGGERRAEPALTLTGGERRTEPALTLTGEERRAKPALTLTRGERRTEPALTLTGGERRTEPASFYLTNPFLW